MARVVCPIAGPPVHGGVVEIEDGRVVEIHNRPHVRTAKLGDVAILPGLVNCHTHLEFSNLERPLGPPHPFAAWISSVVAERRRRTNPAHPTDRAERDPIARGLEECFRTGTSLVGDIVTGQLEHADEPATIIEDMRQTRLTSFRELLAPTPAGVESTWRTADGYLKRMESDAIRESVGLSPHAPYTVTTDLLHQAVERAARESRPLAMHVAETLEELELLEHGTGPLVEMLQRVDQWDAAAIQATNVMEILESLSKAPRVLVVHGNYLTERELRFLSERPHMSLIYCPRTHAYFQHARHPLPEALRLGVNVGLGTDSRASNPDLNLWEEAKVVAHSFPELDPATILNLATAGGARALGQSSRHGVIEPGRPADLCCISLDAAVPDPVRAALGPQARVVGAMHSGEWLLDPQPRRS